MKISFILPVINIGGGVRSTFELANRLQAKGHDVSVVYPLIVTATGASWCNFKVKAYQALETIKNLKRGKRLDWFDLKANLIGVPTLSEKYIPRGDIIVATWWANAYDVNGYAEDKGEKFYFIRHYEIWGGPENLVNRTYTLPLNKIATSAYLKDLIEKKFKVAVFGPLPNGIDFNLFYKEEANFDCHRPKRVGMLYRRHTWKGINDGLKAFQMAKKAHPEIKLVLFGQRPLLRDRKIIGQIDKPEFYLWPAKEHLRKIYNSLDIFIFPSHCEGFGNPPMEAMACGAACVTTNVGAVPDYTIASKTALVSPPRDAKALARNLISLLENEEKRKQLAENGHDYIKQFTWDKTVAQLEGIFKNACQVNQKSV